jgi:ATP-dependent DNA helicase RecG
MIMASGNALEHISSLNQPLTSLKGIGPRRGAMLAQRGLHTLLDLFFFMPIRYEDKRRILPIAETGEGQHCLVAGKVIRAREQGPAATGRRVFTLRIKDESGLLDLIWFHFKRPYLKRFSRSGSLLLAYGFVRKHLGQRQIVHPELTPVSSSEDITPPGIVAVYPHVKGISKNLIRTLMGRVLNRYEDEILDGLPEALIRRLDLPNLGEALRSVHIPPPDADVTALNGLATPGHRRLVFERFFHVMLGLAFHKRIWRGAAAPVLKAPSDYIAGLPRYFPFVLTDDQMDAVTDIIKDMGGGRPMSRLIHGDVGCGKTAVCLLAAHVTVMNHHQVAIMVPTQVLAKQHYDTFRKYAKTMGFKPTLLTGSLSKSTRQQMKTGIQKGEFNIIIGTHALIQQDVAYADLGLVVIDEQHRFGVRQRGLMAKKGVNPHLLVMTATPIPRTLAMTVYGDLDVSVIKKYPTGRLPVETRLFGQTQKREVLNLVQDTVASGRQAMVVCPVIDVSEDHDLKSATEMYSRLKRIFAPHHKVGLIHGRLDPEEKERVMEDFQKGKTHLLVGTTVIEVGVHVPGVKTLVVEQPERFGLAQLHQIRGRAGRGLEQGLCLMMLSKDLSEHTLSRLKFFAACHDGFRIAEKDLELRGQGQLAGERQSGLGELNLAEMLREPELLFTAKKEAENMVASDPMGKSPGIRHVLERVEPLVSKST